VTVIIKDFSVLSVQI